MRRALIVVALLLFVTACGSAPATVQPTGTPSVWSAPLTLAQTPQSDAPALVSNNGGLVAAWIGSDSRGVHQDARQLNGSGQLTDVITLPLPPTHPYGQRLFPADNGNTHLLWLDADSGGQTTLYEALLTPDLTVARGPVAVSSGLALNFSAVPDGAGGLWVAWSGGQLSELSVYTRHIDDEGRPLLEANTVASNADHPALVVTNRGDLWLFWLQNGQLMREALGPSTTSPAEALTSILSLASGDRLTDFRAALDATSAYAFWDITRADGTNEAWLTAGSLSASAWGQPQRLSIKVDPTAQVDTGFKLGSIPAASLGGDTALRWVEPLTDQYNSLAAVVESDAGLGIITLQGGDLEGYTLAAPNVKLIGAPTLVLNVSGNFAIAWAAPGDNNTANLQLIQTQK
ncbi:MAG TPA: hypothetical protein VHD90_11975 [Phototrophicaceae bacterium]|nr:hypothetical protein [Phototrophicaceae bacterium]